MSLPLAGRTVLVTRPRHQADEMVRPLESLGARVFTMPALEIAPPEDPAPFDEALQNLARYDWVVVTSANGVEAVRRRMAELEIAPHTLSARRLAVTGTATAKALEAAFRAPDAMPDEFVADAIPNLLGDVRGLRFLLPRADIARKAIVADLCARGATVDDVAAYRTIAPNAHDLPETAPDFITLTSSSAARGTLNALRAHGHEAWMRNAALVCIGPITEGTVRELGYAPAVVAENHTVAGMISALVQYVHGQTARATQEVLNA